MNYLDVKLGLQSYSLRKMPYEKAVEVVASLQLEYIEAFPGHLPPEPKSVLESKRISEKYGVKPLAHGVNLLGAEEKDLRRIFEFARGAGIKVITADPEPTGFRLLDGLVKEYGIAVAIHNHGPGRRYATAGEVLEAIEGHHELIGMCLDTGHLARAGGDPVEAAEMLGTRMHGLHLKDVSADNRDVVIGEGRLDFKGVFSTLRKTGALDDCAVILEIELEPDNPIPAIRQSLEHIRSMLEKLRD